MPPTEGRKTFPKKGAVKTPRYFENTEDQPTLKKNKKKILKKKKAAKKEGGSSKVAIEMSEVKAKKPASVEKRKKKKSTKVKNDPVKDTSIDYRSLACSDDSDDVMDVSDMLEEGAEPVAAEVPTVNSMAGRKSLQLTASSEAREDSDEESTDDEGEAPDSVPSSTTRNESRGSDSEKESEEEEDEEDSDAEEAASKQFREDMAKLPLSKVREMKEKLGIKLFNKAYFGTTEEDKKKEEKKKEERKKEANEKRGQHRPREISSKKKVGTFRQIYATEKADKKKFDPRFDSRCGDLKEWCFEDNYQFLDQMKREEKEELRRALAESVENGDEERAEKLSKALNRLENQEKARAEKKLKQDTMREIKEENIQRLMQGERARFKTKAEVRMRVMEKKFEQLKDEHKLDKYLKRKGKKEAQKAKKMKPATSNFEKQYGYQ